MGVSIRHFWLIPSLLLVPYLVSFALPVAVFPSGTAMPWPENSGFGAVVAMCTDVEAGFFTCPMAVGPNLCFLLGLGCLYFRIWPGAAALSTGALGWAAIIALVVAGKWLEVLVTGKWLEPELPDPPTVFGSGFSLWVGSTAAWSALVFTSPSGSAFSVRLLFLIRCEEMRLVGGRYGPGDAHVGSPSRRRASDRDQPPGPRQSSSPASTDWADVDLVEEVPAGGVLGQLFHKATGLVSDARGGHRRFLGRDRHAQFTGHRSSKTLLPRTLAQERPKPGLEPKTRPFGNRF